MRLARGPIKMGAPQDPHAVEVHPGPPNSPRLGLPHSSNIFLHDDLYQQSCVTGTVEMRKQCRYFVYVYLELIFISILLSFDHALAQPWNERASGADSFSALRAEVYQVCQKL